MTTAAAIDRLVHHSIIFELNLPGYRLEAAKTKKEVAPDMKLPLRIAAMAFFQGKC